MYIFIMYDCHILHDNYVYDYKCIYMYAYALQSNNEETNEKS